MELFDVLKVIGRRKWLIITIVVLATLAAIYSARSATIPKEARNVLHFNFSMPQEIDVQNAYPMIRIPPEQGAFDFVALFSTDKVLNDGLKNAGIEMDLYDAKKSLTASVQVVKIGAEDERTSFIEVIARNTDGDLAVKLVNGVTQSATELFVDMLTRSVSANREFLENQADVYQKEVKVGENEMRAFLQTHAGFGQMMDESSIATRKVQLDASMSNLNAELAGLEAKINFTKADLEAYKAGEIDYIPPAIKGNSSVITLQNRIIEKQIDRSELLGKYSENHPAVKKINQEIAEAEAAMRGEIIRFLEEELKVYQAEKKEKSSQVGSFDAGSQTLEGETGELALDRIQYDEVSQNLEMDRESYRLIKGKLSEAIVEENKARQRYTVDIIEAATTASPSREIWFQPAFRIALAVVGSIFFAFVLAFFAEYMSSKRETGGTAKAVKA